MAKVVLDEKMQKLLFEKAIAGIWAGSGDGLMSPEEIEDAKKLLAYILDHVTDKESKENAEELLHQLETDPMLFSDQYEERKKRMEIEED